jgi:hypothetical protein
MTTKLLTLINQQSAAEQGAPVEPTAIQIAGSACRVAHQAYRSIQPFSWASGPLSYNVGHPNHPR